MSGFFRVSQCFRTLRSDVSENVAARCSSPCFILGGVRNTHTVTQHVGESWCSQALENHQILHTSPGNLGDLRKRSVDNNGPWEQSPLHMAKPEIVAGNNETLAIYSRKCSQCSSYSLFLSIQRVNASSLNCRLGKRKWNAIDEVAPIRQDFTEQVSHGDAEDSAQR